MQLPAFIIADVIKAAGAGSASDTTMLSWLLTDSRDLTYPSATVFFSLRTDVNNGHNFIPGLYDAGVRYFVVDEDVDAASIPGAVIWHVDSVVDALQRLAAYVRSLMSSVPVVAVTGSQGKTVVKELVYLSLCGKYNVVRSPRSYNSQIGVPLSVWLIDDDTDMAIFEAGISIPGEMERLQSVLRPDIGVFTSLTDEHSDGFTSLFAKAREKALLFRDCATVYMLRDAVNADIIRCALLEVNPSVQIVNVVGGDRELAASVASYLLYRVGGMGYLPAAENALMAASDRITSRIDVTETLKHCLIVYDSFTNDLRSVYDALNSTCRHLTPGRSLTLILVEPDAPMSLRNLARLLRAKGVSRFIGVGPSFSGFSCDGVRVEHAADVDAFVNTYTISDFCDEVILVKGGNRCSADDIKTLLEAPRHETVMEVDLGAITRNFNFFRSKIKPTTGIVAMVKASGYGVGALELAKTLQAQGAAYLAVAVVDEGVELRHAGITMPIIVMNPIGTSYKALFDHRLEPSVFSMRELDMLLANARRHGIEDYPVHIKLDTGMHRLGFLPDEIDALAAVLCSQSHVRAASVFSHLATADCLDQNSYTQSQFDAFASMSSRLIEALGYPVLRHILNTAGILRYPQYQYDMVRLGIGLYGVAPIDGYRLETVARLLSTIISIRHWDAGTTVGYGRRGVISGPVDVATVAIGYADGLDRHLSNGAAYMLVNGHRCPIVGNICMDQCMIDVTGADASVGDTVEIFGINAPITRLSDTLGTIPYEILTSISPRVKRIYFRE